MDKHDILSILQPCKDIDECASFPYLHGTCTDPVNGYIWEYAPGNSGNRCDTDKLLFCLRSSFKRAT